MTVKEAKRILQELEVIQKKEGQLADRRRILYDKMNDMAEKEKIKIIERLVKEGDILEKCKHNQGTYERMCGRDDCSSHTHCSSCRNELHSSIHPTYFFVTWEERDKINMACEHIDKRYNIPSEL